jgi:hypothetical protein
VREILQGAGPGPVITLERPAVGGRDVNDARVGETVSAYVAVTNRRGVSKGGHESRGASCR